MGNLGLATTEVIGAAIRVAGVAGTMITLDPCLITPPLFPTVARTMAGGIRRAAGASDARIIGTCMEAELVSIAGVYRTFDDGWPKELKGKPVQVLLQEDRLDLRPMALK